MPPKGQQEAVFHFGLPPLFNFISSLPTPPPSLLNNGKMGERKMKDIRGRWKKRKRERGQKRGPEMKTHGSRKTIKLLASKDRYKKNEMKIVAPTLNGGDEGKCTLAVRIHAAMDLESGRRHWADAASIAFGNGPAGCSRDEAIKQTHGFCPQSRKVKRKPHSRGLCPESKRDSQHSS